MMETLPDTTTPTHPLFRFSFGPFLVYLKEQQKRALAGNLSGLYTYLIRQFEKMPVYSDSPKDVIGPVRLAELFELVSITVLPMVPTKQNLPYAFGAPVPLELIYTSPAFAQLMNDFPDLLSEMATQTHDDDRLRFIYRLVLEHCYHIRNLPRMQSSFRFHKHIYGLTKYFQIDINTAFVAPHLDGDLPPLQPAWVDFVKGTGPTPNADQQLPVGEFTFGGFSFFTVEDVTEAETIRQLRDVFTHLHTDTELVIYERFESAFRNLCGQPDLHISILPMPQVNGSFVYHPDLTKRSLFMQYAGISMDSYKDPEAQQNARDFFKQSSPYVFSNLEGLPDPEWKALYQKGIRSFLLYPITTQNEVLGILEMGSTQPYALSEGILARIERILPLVQELLRYQMNQFNDSLEQLVKQKYTSLQPAIEWKFYEAAWEDMRLERADTPGTEAGGPADQPVRFPQVFPLYGTVDIRDSSAERHKALRQDLMHQLQAACHLLVDADFFTSPLYQQLLTECHDWLHKLTNGIANTADIILFLQRKVNAAFYQVRENQPGSTGLINRYFAQINPHTGQFNKASLCYEQTMNRINNAVNEYVDGEEKKLQLIYPHYFERQRTDGTEYTIYLGNSIAPDKPFDEALRQRFTQWQLITMVEMARLTHRLLPALPLPLQTTQLILAYPHPIDISFRQDERRFDVEGSHSIRHEVIKKRIDKAKVNGTQERLTQPDTLAIVFTHTNDLSDFMPVIRALQQTGKLKTRLDYVDLEPLQGIANLKALRIKILYNAPEGAVAA